MNRSRSGECSRTNEKMQIEFLHLHICKRLNYNRPMIITIASFKGGVGKTTTAVHLAACLCERATTLLLDGDANRSASSWAERGSFPFKVVDERQAAKCARDYEHIVIDTEARPDIDDLRQLVKGCDLLVIPTTPDVLSLDALMLTVEELKSLGADQYRVLLTIIPPRPSRDGDEAADSLKQAGIPLFSTGIRRLVAFQKAALSGVLVHAAKDSRAADAWADYASIGAELFEYWNARQITEAIR